MAMNAIRSQNNPRRDATNAATKSSTPARNSTLPSNAVTPAVSSGGGYAAAEVLRPIARHFMKTELTISDSLYAAIE